MLMRVQRVGWLMNMHIGGTRACGVVSWCSYNLKYNIMTNENMLIGFRRIKDGDLEITQRLHEHVKVFTILDFC